MITRRQVLKLASSVMLLPLACSHITNNNKGKSASNKYFHHGVASGDPNHSSVVIWTRASGIDRPALVNWQLATDATFNNTLKKGSFKTDASRDYTVKIVVNSLPSGEEFFYKFDVNGKSSVINPNSCPGTY